MCLNIAGHLSSAVPLCLHSTGRSASQVNTPEACHRMVSVTFSSLFAYIATPWLNSWLRSNHGLMSHPSFLPCYISPTLIPGYWLFLPYMFLHNVHFNMKPELMTVVMPSNSIASCTVTLRHLKALLQVPVPYAGCYRCKFSFVFCEYKSNTGDFCRRKFCLFLWSTV